jgi:hypothetical protein
MQKALFDLKSLMPSQSSEIELRHPVTKEGLGMYVTISGKDSESWQAAQRTRMNSRLNEAKKTGATTPTAEQIEAENMTMLCRAILGWRSLVLGGEELLYTPDNVRMLLTDYPWVKDQIDEEISDRGNFIKS